MSATIRNPLPWSDLLRAGVVPLVVVRHGQTERNREARFSGHDDVPINDTGAQQARRLAETLQGIPFTALWSSPLLRARQTLAPLAEATGLPVRTDARLAELDQGELDGLPAHALPTRYPDFFAAWRKDPAEVTVPGGETFGACQRRMLAALRDLAAEADGPVAVASHKMAIAAVMCAAIGLPLRRYRWIGQDNAAINLLGVGPEQRILLRRLNERSHLSG